MKILSLGFGHFVLANRVVSIHPYKSLPIKRMALEAEKVNKLINSTFGKKTRSLICLDTLQFIASSVDSATLIQRMERLNKEGES